MFFYSQLRSPSLNCADCVVQASVIFSFHYLHKLGMHKAACKWHVKMHVTLRKCNCFLFLDMPLSIYPKQLFFFMMNCFLYNSWINKPRSIPDFWRGKPQKAKWKNCTHLLKSKMNLKCNRETLLQVLKKKKRQQYFVLQCCYQYGFDFRLIQTEGWKACMTTVMHNPLN